MAFFLGVLAVWLVLGAGKVAQAATFDIADGDVAGLIVVLSAARSAPATYSP